MKYMIEYTTRVSGLTCEESFKNSESLLKTWERWEEEAKSDLMSGLNVLNHVVKLGCNGGYVLVETDEPCDVAKFVSKFTFWAEPTINPVIEVDEAVPISFDSLAWAKGVY
jgi:Domain of unknown function (DUF3303)